MKSAIGRLWLAFAFNCAALVLLFAVYYAFHNNPQWDSEGFAVIVFLVGNAWAVVGGFVSLFFMRPYVAANGASAWKSGAALALITLPLSLMLSVEYATANMIELYVMRSPGEPSDALIYSSGIVTYGLVAFLAGTIAYRTARRAPRWYAGVVICIMVTLVLLQLLPIAHAASHPF